MKSKMSLMLFTEISALSDGVESVCVATAATVRELLASGGGLVEVEPLDGGLARAGLGIQEACGGPFRGLWARQR